MQYDYLDFQFFDLPEQFDFYLDNNHYNAKLRYNEYNDSFYMDLWDENMVPIALGEKLVYGMPLWGSITDPRLPITQLIPLDDDNIENAVNASNFPDTVKLCIVNADINDDTDDNDDYNTSDDSDNSGLDTDATDTDNNDYGNDPIVGGGS